ncbi:hypothetical protein FCM35_KLT17531 [Carex littledalei]|uniref:Uncharacterized protein n=1 Tax=Carex littledalei TaxID=544730 RepID=A0A833RC71_9POAL|nr:hypothetical protein FCM35_KLT17531 [Carex littledalei]
MRFQIYTRVGRRSLRTRGFRLGSNHFSVHRLRKKIWTIFGFINRCMQFLCRCPKESKSKGCDVRTDSRRNLVPAGREEVRLRSYMRSNSFYAEAIKDCLDFIKRNSVPLDNTMFAWFLLLIHFKVKRQIKGQLSKLELFLL